MSLQHTAQHQVFKIHCLAKKDFEIQIHSDHVEQLVLIEVEFSSAGLFWIQLTLSEQCTSVVLSLR